MNAIAPLNAKLTLNAMNASLHSLNANLTLNAINTNLTLNAMNHKVIPINTKVVCEKVYDSKSMTTKNTIPRSMVAKHMTAMNSRTNNDENYQHSTFLSYEQCCDRAPNRVL